MRARLALAAMALACATSALGQYKVPDNLPPLPDGGAACNERRTHCLVNFEDWMAGHMALDIAVQRIHERDSEIAALKVELELVRKGKRCATVTPLPHRPEARADR